MVDLNPTVCTCCTLILKIEKHQLNNHLDEQELQVYLRLPLNASRSSLSILMVWIALVQFLPQKPELNQ
jgi:hypothetical protein